MGSLLLKSFKNTTCLDCNQMIGYRNTPDPVHFMKADYRGDFRPGIYLPPNKPSTTTIRDYRDFQGIAMGYDFGNILRGFGCKQYPFRGFELPPWF